VPLLTLGNLSADFSRTLYSPTFLETIYQSNHFMWGNDFAKSEATQYGAKYEMPEHHFYLAANRYTITDYIHYNSESTPEQFSKEIIIKQAVIGKNFYFGKLRFNNSLYWQHSDHNEIIPLTDFAVYSSLNYESRFFKKKLLAQFGIDAHYTSEYYAPAYNPAVSIFYLQQSIKTNGYALADVFFNFKIKTARIFIKMQNAGDGIFRKGGYYLTPHYPMPGRLLLLGVNWRFFD
jgi:outer membrane receptor protein involved in Fe transport